MRQFDSLNYRKHKRPTQSTAIILLLFAFAVVLGLMAVLRSSWTVLDQLPQHRQTGVVDSVYVHQSSFLSLTAPNGWFIRETGDTVLAVTDTLEKLLPQITWLVDVVPPGRDVQAKTRVGALKWPETAPARKIGIQILVEMIELYEKDGQRIRIVTPITGPAHRILQGVYYVTVIPGDTVKMPVRVLSVLPRQQFAYVIDSRCREADYAALKDELESIVKRVNPLPMQGLFK